MQEEQQVKIIIPQSIENLKLPDPALLLEFMELKDRTLVLNYDIDMRVSVLSRQIIRFNKEDKGLPINERKPIYLYIDSDGGSTYDAIGLRSVIELSNTPVVTVALNISASAAFIVFMGSKVRLAMPNARFLIHRGYVAVSGERSTVEDTMKEYDRSDKEWEDYLLSHTKIEKTTYTKQRKKDWWMNAAEAIEYGIATKTIENIDELYQ